MGDASVSVSVWDALKVVAEHIQDIFSFKDEYEKLLAEKLDIEKQKGTLDEY